MQSIIFFLGFIVPFFACKQGAEKLAIEPVVKEHVHFLGSTPITIKTSTYRNSSNLVFIQLHDNEQTAERAARKVLEQQDGVLLHIENKSKRTISFSLKGKKYVFDPNRMFTKKGVRESLQKLSTYNSAAATEVHEFAQAVLNLIPDKAIIIALHNNTNENYSILSYDTERLLKQSTKTTYRNKAHDEDNFFITTDEKIFSVLKKKGYNTVLQNNSRAYDDGSLSVYMGRQNRMYVNVEAQHGHLEQQIEMIEVVLEEVKSMR